MSENNVNASADVTLAAAQDRIARLEAELDGVNARLIKAESEKSHFISHTLNELNNPLAAIIGLTEQLMSMKQQYSGHIHQSLQWVHDESAYLDFQLKNLFMAAELEAGVAELALARVDVHSLLNGVTLRYLSLAQRKGVTLECNDGHALLALAGNTPYFETDGPMLGLVYANILDNAVKFSPKEGKVHVTVQMDKAGLTLVVEDEGPGMSEQDKAFALDRFWQADSTTTKLYRGLGLGLSVTNSCVELMGGRLQLLPAGEGHGLRVELQLPIMTSSTLSDTAEENIFFFDDQGAGDDEQTEQF